MNPEFLRKKSHNDFISKIELNNNCFILISNNKNRFYKFVYYRLSLCNDLTYLSELNIYLKTKEDYLIYLNGIIDSLRLLGLYKNLFSC